MTRLNYSSVILASLLCVLFLPLINANTVKQSTDYDIRIPVRLAGGIATDILCNITVIGPPPNMTILIDYKEMTDQEAIKGYHNYTLNSTHTSEKGEYNYYVTCLHASENDTESYSFLVNPAGIEPTTQRTDSTTRSIYFIFGIALLLLLAFFFTNQSVPIKWTVFIFAVLFFLIGINIIFVSLQDEIVNPKLEGFFSGFTVISWYFYYFAAGILIILWALTFINTWVYKKNLQNARRYGLA